MLQNLVAYEDGRIDGFFSDNTAVVVHGFHIDYYSQTGTKATIRSSEITSNASVSSRVVQILNKFNQYSDSSIYTSGMIDEQEEVIKSTRIKELVWGKSVENSKTGHRLYSIDRSSYVQINFDLMLLKISYLQQINDRCLVQKTKKQTNFSKELLLKYNLEYQQYPEPAKVSTIAYKYIRQNKVFVLNNTPSKWQYPAWVLWNQILESSQQKIKPIIEPYCLTKTNTTVLQGIKFIEQAQQIKIQNIGVPVFRYPRHSSSVTLVITVDNDKTNVGWIKEGEAVCYDGQGYWILNFQSLHLKFKNTLDSQKIYNVNAIPLIVRENNSGYERNIKDFLIAVYNASSHKPIRPLYEKLAQLQALKAPTSNTTTQSMELQKQYTQYGIITIFSNHTITGKFNDGIFIIANFLTHVVKIKDRDGNSLTTGTNDKFYAQYIKLAYQSYQNVYYPEEHHKRNKMEQEMQQRINFNESIVEHISSGDYLKKTHNSSTKQGCGNIQDILKKNEELLKKLEKYK